jgi:hypothetical protein
MTGAGLAEDSRLVPAAAEPPRTARRRDDALRRAARTGLLGFRQPDAAAGGKEA